MAEQPGFLSTLGLGPVDERDAVQAQRDALATQRQQRIQALGRQTGVGLGGLLGGAIGAARGQGFTGSAQRAHQRVSDFDTARATGLTLDQVRGRRKIRQLTGDSPSDPSFEGRVSMLKRVLNIANQHGDTEVVGNTLRQLQAVTTEQKEFEKLSAQTRTEQARADVNEEAAEQSDVLTAFRDGSP